MTSAAVSHCRSAAPICAAIHPRRARCARTISGSILRFVRGFPSCRGRGSRASRGRERPRGSGSRVPTCQRPSRLAILADERDQGGCPLRGQAIALQANRRTGEVVPVHERIHQQLLERGFGNLQLTERVEPLVALHVVQVALDERKGVRELLRERGAKSRRSARRGMPPPRTA